jgi:centractin
MAGALQGDTFIGSKAEQYRGLLKLERPMAHGVVEDWDVMERIWSHLYIHELKVSPDEVGVFF